jgi:hypothetical protein
MPSASYKPHRLHDERIQSAKRAIRALLSVNLVSNHKSRLLGVCIWKLSEADGKWNVRYWSKMALTAPKNERRHEHVHEIRKLVRSLLQGQSADTVARRVVACIVTRSEHKRLSAPALYNIDGWNRYRAAKVPVIDLVTGRRKT